MGGMKFDDIQTTVLYHLENGMRSMVTFIKTGCVADLSSPALPLDS